MKTPEYEFKPLRTLSVFLACSALIAGCAGNSVKPDSQTDTTSTSSQLSNKQIGDAVNTSITQSTPTDVTPKTSKNSVAIQQSASMATLSSNPSTVAEGKSIKQEQTTVQSNTAPLAPTQSTFYFGVNQAQIDKKDEAILAQHASFLKANPTLILEIDGHTDSSGSHTYNEHLSKRRADAVANILIKDGVKRSQLIINALADSKPLPDQTDPGKNRRVDIQYDDTSMVSSK